MCGFSSLFVVDLISTQASHKLIFFFFLGVIEGSEREEEGCGRETRDFLLKKRKQQNLMFSRRWKKSHSCLLLCVFGGRTIPFLCRHRWCMFDIFFYSEYVIALFFQFK